jgi:hypothetical protein
MMTGELEKKVRTTIENQSIAEKLVEAVDSAAKDFPCLECPSHENCGTFKWYLKWFGEENSKH